MNVNKEPEKTRANHKPDINLEYIDNKLQCMFKFRQQKEIESRIRFQIQDLMDDYEKLWKFEIYKARQHQPPDSEGFANFQQKQYVPKDSIITREDGGR